MASLSHSMHHSILLLFCDIGGRSYATLRIAARIALELGDDGNVELSSYNMCKAPQLGVAFVY